LLEMATWAGVTLACAALLVVSGIPKLRNPGSTVTAMRSVGAHRTNAAGARLLTLVELAVGATAIAVGGRWADAALSGVYLGFSLFLIVALRRNAPSCGCAGRVDTPPTLAHLAMTVMFAAASGAAAVIGRSTGLLAIIQASRPTQSITLFGYAAAVTCLSWTLLNLAPRAGVSRS
jgi:hypothetical protein